VRAAHRFSADERRLDLILPGIDPQTKKFTQPPEQIKREIAALKANKSISAGKAHSVHGEHRAGPKVLRPTFAAHAGAGFEPATCGLEIHGHLQREAPLPVCAKDAELAVVGAYILAGRDRTAWLGM